MALERIVTKYEPEAGTDYIGTAGQLWLDIETGYLHLSDDLNQGGSLVISQGANGLLNVPTLTVSGGAELGTSFLTFPNGENASIGIIDSAGLTFYNSDQSTHFTKNVVIDGNEGQFLARQNGGSGAYGGYSFVQDGSHDTGMYSAGDGNIQFYNNATKTVEFFQPAAGHADTMVYGTFTLQPLNYVPAGRPGMMAMCDGSSGWNGGGDGLQHLMVYVNGGWHKVY